VKGSIGVIMNEDENTKLVRQAYDSMMAGDIESFIKLLDPDVEWHMPAMEDVPFAGVRYGHNGVREFARLLNESHEVVEFLPGQFIAQGKIVVALGRFTMRVRATGRKIVSDWAHAWTIAGGKVTYFQEYVDTAAVIRGHAMSLSAR
jgi:ketosteroid isomerase-like protein